jgi:hypothetical protein
VRLTYTDIWNKFLRNIQSVGVTSTGDANLAAEFRYQFGVYYQLMLAKLKNYKTYQTYSFYVGMYAQKLTSGAQPVAISTITSSGTTATVTTGTAHGYSTSDSVAINNVAINGINTSGYNGSFTITVTSTTTFTYTLPASVNSVAGDHAQYYNNPNGFVTVDGITISVGTVGSGSVIRYPLKLESSQMNWEQKNIVPMQIAIPPQNYFPRRDDFGIWPIPRTLYNATMYYHYRDRNLLVDDVTTGTVSVTQGSNKLTATSGTPFTAAMVGRWFEVTDTTVPGQGYSYRINHYTSTSQVEFDSIWQGATTTGITSWRIGESPEIPEDLQMYLPDAITGGYLKDVRKDPANAQLFLNSFWTGDMNNSSRKEDDENVSGGLIGGMKAYGDREDQRIVDRGEDNNINFLRWEPWGAHLTSS